MSVGIENDRYKITKNEDKLILTDKKTQKARILEPNDIDYVIDDNQKIRDSNVIENYFRLKDDKSELKFNTKKADYVSEYKEAEKYTNKKYQDSVEDFLSKWNFSKEELDNLASVPDESTIRKFETRTDEEKKSIANDFRLMKKTLLEERKITTDPFTYLKAYFKNYVSVEEMESLAKLKIDDYLHNRAFYSNDYEYDKVKSLEVKSLKDLKDNKVDYFGHINLDLLDNFSKRMKVIKDNAKEILEIDDNPEAKNINFKYNIGIITNPDDLDIYKKEKKRRETKEVKVETPMKPTVITKEETKPIEPSFIDIDKISKVEPIPIDDDNMEPPMIDFEDVSKENTKAWATWKLDPAVEKYYDAVPDQLEGVLKYYDYFKKNIIPVILQNNNKFSTIDPPKALQGLMSEKIDASTVKTKDIIEKIKALLTYVPPETQQEFIRSSKGFVGGKDGIVSDKITAYMIIENKIIHGIEKNISSLMRKYSHDEYTAKEFIDEIAENGIEAFSDPIRIHVVDKICKNYRGLEPYLFFINVYWKSPVKRNISFNTPNFTIKTGDTFNKSTLTRWGPMNENGDKLKEKFINIIEALSKNPKLGVGRLGVGWTDDTLTRIDNIMTQLRGSGSMNQEASGWTDDTLTRIESIMTQLKGSGNYASGWTDDTLTRIESIMTQLRGLKNNASGWTDDTLTRIESIIHHLG
jgi:ribosome assembly protein YihI (activator of Der GTPase)